MPALDSKDSDDSNSIDISKKTSFEDALRGKTLQVYTYMIKKGEPVGVREVQRDLGFSSPSVANYHIEKLIALSLVNQDQHGRYYISQKVQVGVLHAFINVGGITIPRMLFFAAFFTTLLVSYLVISINELDIHAIGFAASGTVAFWFETIRMWRRKPF